MALDLRHRDRVRRRAVAGGSALLRAANGTRDRFLGRSRDRHTLAAEARKIVVRVVGARFVHALEHGLCFGDRLLAELGLLRAHQLLEAAIDIRLLLAWGR